MPEKSKPARKALPGQTLRRDLMQSLIPPLFSFIRFSMRLTAGGLIYLAGFPQVALVVAVMSVMTIVGPVESQIAKSIAKALPRGRDHVRKQRAKRVGQQKEREKKPPESGC